MTSNSASSSARLKSMSVEYESSMTLSEALALVYPQGIQYARQLDILRLRLVRLALCRDRRDSSKQRVFQHELSAHALPHRRNATCAPIRRTELNKLRLSRAQPLLEHS